ncbi:MAG: ABC transporter ATP-binding protein [Planctomycetota bacterium]
MKTDSVQPNSGEPLPLISARQLGRHYSQGDIHALRDVDLTIEHEDYLAICGKSGSGKTTLLNLLGGLDRPTSGTLTFDGKLLDQTTNLDAHRAEHVGFIFQSYCLLPNLTAIENVQIPMFESRSSASERMKRASELLEQVGLGERTFNLPNQLSGGECQRVAVARALANQPSLILADEPTGAMDSETGAQVVELLETLQRDCSLTLIVVTHDETLAARAERQIRLTDGTIDAADGNPS